MDLYLSPYKNADHFLQAVGEALYSRETLNNLMLGVTERLVKEPDAYKDPLFAAVVEPEGELQLAAVWTPPYNMILAGGEKFQEGIPLLIDYLKDNQIPLPGVIGPVDISDHFIKTWEQKCRQSSQAVMHQRIYELRTVNMPQLPVGHFRIAVLPDAPVIAEWLEAFEAETSTVMECSYLKRAEDLIMEGHVFVWEQDTELVSMAMKVRPVAHSIMITGVYTPPGKRCHGFATALVARLSQLLLDSGYKFVNLFTDLENPTSNSIYRKIGYHPVADFRVYKFASQEESGNEG